MDWGPAIRPTRAEIDLDFVVANSRTLADRAGTGILAVVKADGYGHGAVECTLALEAAKTVEGVAVSLVEEGIELRRAGVELPILVMGPSLMGAHDEVVTENLTPMLSDEADVDLLAKAARKAGRRVDLHLKADTGMGRLGIAEARVPQLMKKILAMPELQLTALASHLACADVDDPEDRGSRTAQQLERFRTLAARARSDAPSLLFHIANSAGILRFPTAQYNLARPGLALYGNGSTPSDQLQQGLRLVSAVTQLRDLPAGKSVGYGAMWTAKRPSRLAIVPVGYADGFPRNLSHKASALLHGQRCPVVGTISMDISVVDVTDIPATQRGDEVVLLGRQGSQTISVAEWAAQAGISEYEVTCGISKRVPRVYRSAA